MTKKIILYVLVAALAAFAGWQMVSMFYHPEAAEANVEDGVSPFDVASLLEDQSVEVLEGMPLNLAELRVNNYRDSSFTLAELFAGEGKTRVARFVVTACPPCVDSTFREIIAYKAAQPQARVLVLLSGAPSRDLKVLENQHQGKFQFFNADALPIDWDDAVTPAVFDLDSKGIISDYHTIHSTK